VAVYEYTCVQCGSFDLRCPIGTAPDRERCPACGGSARRVFSPPMLGVTSSPARSLIALEEKSADAPEVVTTVPPKVAPAAPPAHPAWSRLPKP